MTRNENARSNGKVTVQANEDISQITFKCVGGYGRPAIILHVARASQSNRDHAMFHGFIQRIRDAAAGKSIADGFEAMQKLVDHYETGTVEWSPAPARGPALAEMLVQALSALYPAKTVEQLTAYVEAKKASGQRKLAADPKVAAKIAELFGAKEDGFDLESDLDTFTAETGPEALDDDGEEEIVEDDGEGLDAATEDLERMANAERL